MFCPKCGSPNANDASFCSACGSMIASTAATVPGNSQQQFFYADQTKAAYAQPNTIDRYAGFWLRFGAVMLDGLILSLTWAIVIAIISFVIPSRTSTDTRGIVFMLVSILLYWLYFTILESSERQATLGKRIVGLKVTDLKGERISFGRANGRYWSKLISSAILGIGYILAAFTDKKQALHDIISSCLVVKK